MPRKKVIQKDNTSSHWKKLIHLKMSSFFDNASGVPYILIISITSFFVRLLTIPL